MALTGILEDEVRGLSRAPEGRFSPPGLQLPPAWGRGAVYLGQSPQLFSGGEQGGVLWVFPTWAAAGTFGSLGHVSWASESCPGVVVIA